MRASGANCKYTASGLCWNWVVSHSFPRETIIHDLSWLIRKPMSTKSGTEKVRTSKPKRIYAPRIISDHIMVQEDFERLHKFLSETETSQKSPTIYESWSRRNGRSCCMQVGA